MNTVMPHDNISLASLFDAMQDAVVVYNDDFQILYCNRSMEDMLGYKNDALLGKSIFEITPSTFHEIERNWFELIARHEPIQQQRTLRISAEGAIISISLSISPLKNKDGDVIGATQIFRDIGKQIKNDLAGSYLSVIMDDSKDAIIRKSLDGIITSWNKASEQIYGYTAEEVIGKPMSMLVPDDRQQEESMFLNRILGGENIQNFESVGLSKDGNLIPLLLTVSAIFENGKIVGISKIAHDIRPIKIAEERQAMLAAIVESSDDAIISKTLHGIVTSWNQGAEKIFGYREREAIGKHISFIIPFDRIAEEDRIIASIRRGQKVDHFQTVRKRKNGTLVTVSLTISPVRDHSGNIIGASKVARDITQEQKAHDALRQYASKLQILNSMAKAISEKLDIQNIMQKIIDAATPLLEAEFGVFSYNTFNEQGEPDILHAVPNDATLKISRDEFPKKRRVSPASFGGKSVIRINNVTPEEPSLETCSSLNFFHQHFNISSFLAVPVYSTEGTIMGGLFFGHRSANRFSLEHEDLIVNMASQAGVALYNSMLFEQVKDLNRKKDEFIAMATHELKTPMTTLSGFLQLVKLRVENDPINSSMLKKALKQLNKLGLLLNDLFDVSKIQAGKMQLNLENADLSELTKEIIESYIENDSCTIHLNAPEHILVMADRLRLEQVIVNFIDNAIKYSSKEKEVVVTIDDLGSHAQLSVKDSGIGISKEDMKGIFTQFYRVASISKKTSGLGLGLYISKEIIERHNGNVKAESEAGIGSTFSFTIPKLTT